MTLEQGELILYQSDEGQAAVDVRLKDETVWLSQAQMQELFSRERSVITKHINNVFKEGEVDKNQVCAKFAHTATDGKTYQVSHYNLDVIGEITLDDTCSTNPGCSGDLGLIEHFRWPRKTTLELMLEYFKNHPLN
jgi:hypothetical protein